MHFNKMLKNQNLLLIQLKQQCNAFDYIWASITKLCIYIILNLHQLILTHPYIFIKNWKQQQILQQLTNSKSICHLKYLKLYTQIKLKAIVDSFHPYKCGGKLSIIMIIQQKLKNSIMLSFQTNISFKKEQRNYEQLTQLQTDQKQLEDPIERFFNYEFLVHHIPKIYQNSLEQEHSRNPTLEFQDKSCQQHETALPIRKKSIFHNFQKHLITLIKKFITIDQSYLLNHPYASLALSLWNAFVKTRSFNKKILHMVFGVFDHSKISQEFQKISGKYFLFETIYHKNHISDIIEAQTFIRKEVVLQTSTLTFQFLEASCNVSRFEEFYQYFESFVSELTVGPMTKRMTKNRKFNVVEKLKGKQIN